jgi:hypothetical protein
MTSVNQNFVMFSGDDKTLRFTVLDSSSASIDLTGASVTWMLATDDKSASLIKKSTDSGCGISISGCTFDVDLSPSDTDGLTGVYYHEAQVRDSASDLSTVATGWANIKHDLIAP